MLYKIFPQHQINSPFSLLHLVKDTLISTQAIVKTKTHLLYSETWCIYYVPKKKLGS